YYVAVCIIILGFSSVVKASQGKESFIIAPTVLKTSVFHANQFYPLLNKVIIPAHPGNNDLFWKSVPPLFHEIGRIYTKLGSYFYKSILSIFNW
ncbi:hypothetical protein, partial [Bartonella saheliensis]|uniref:hypothetical protein n=1 Tax=Bartonella saheliensis TaxID=1457016 RepID=UPI00119FAC4D